MTNSWDTQIPEPPKVPREGLSVVSSQLSDESKLALRPNPLTAGP
jgi:hypothetical protein